MRDFFEKERKHRVGRYCVVVMALACVLAVSVLAGCKPVATDDTNADRPDAANSAVTDSVQDAQDGQDAQDAGDDAAPEEIPESSAPRVKDISQTEPEVHVDLLKLDFAEDELPESYYYRSMTDETGLACYEIQPADSENPITIPMSNTVIYMTDPTSENAGQAYYERITLTYTLDDEPVESVQYQIFVPSVLEPGAIDGAMTSETIVGAADAGTQAGVE